MSLIGKIFWGKEADERKELTWLWRYGLCPIDRMRISVAGPLSFTTRLYTDKSGGRTARKWIVQKHPPMEVEALWLALEAFATSASRHYLAIVVLNPSAEPIEAPEVSVFGQCVAWFPPFEEVDIHNMRLSRFNPPLNTVIPSSTNVEPRMLIAPFTQVEFYSEIDLIRPALIQPLQGMNVLSCKEAATVTMTPLAFRRLFPSIKVPTVDDSFELDLVRRWIVNEERPTHATSFTETLEVEGELLRL